MDMVEVNVTEKKFEDHWPGAGNDFSATLFDCIRCARTKTILNLGLSGDTGVHRCQPLQSSFDSENRHSSVFEQQYVLVVLHRLKCWRSMHKVVDDVSLPSSPHRLIWLSSMKCLCQ